MADTAIEWTQKVWNPTTGCDKVSPGCDNCYALTMAKRLKGMGSAKYQTDGDPRTSGPGFGIAHHPDALTIPLGWRKPQKVFVNSMSDLFHKGVSDDFIARVFAVMAATPQHTYQMLTKRHGRMRSLLCSNEFRVLTKEVHSEMQLSKTLPYRPLVINAWPLPNVWLGVSVEDQKHADIRIRALLDTPAAVRFLSCEPLVGPVDLAAWLDPPLLCGESCQGAPTGTRPDCSVACRQLAGTAGQLGWVIAGGESGPAARPAHPDWFRLMRDQCAAADVPFHFKQHGEWMPVGPLYCSDDGPGSVADEARHDAVTLEVLQRREVIQLERSGYVVDGHQPGDPRTWLMAKVGKKTAGRELDGREHNEFPERAA